jgi:hypothetical protein
VSDLINWGPAINERRDALASYLSGRFTVGPVSSFIRLDDAERRWWQSVADDAFDVADVRGIYAAIPPAPQESA